MAKRKKKEKLVYRLNQSDIKEQWEKQIKFLKNENRNFDDGDEDYAIKIATTLRILFHDTSQSTSLSKSMQLKNEITLWSSGASYTPYNEVSTWSLLSLDVGNFGEGNSFLKYSPIGEEQTDTKHSIYLTFEDWWNEIIFADQKFLYTRQDVVCFLANKDGGAHVDLELNELAYISKLNSLGLEDQNGNPPKYNPLYASVRQIATEVIQSLNLFFDYKSYHTVPSRKSKVFNLKLRNTPESIYNKGFYSFTTKPNGEKLKSPVTDDSITDYRAEKRRWNLIKYRHKVEGDIKELVVIT